MFYRRRLPHLYRDDQSIFLTWRLFGSLPPNRPFPSAGVTCGKAFAVLDRLLDESRTGPFYLRRPTIADMVVEVIHHCADVLGRYTLHAFVVMPNHIHMLVSPSIPLPQLTKTLKGFTAKRANQMLARTGNPFWQEESYDHLVRDRAEWERIKFYIEQNPVRAGLVRRADQYRWSSAGWATGRSPADQEVRPTL
jgi:putative DNA methylase